MLLELPNASPAELTAAEEQAIQRAFDRNPDLLLNGLIPLQGRVACAGKTSPKTTLMHEGKPVSYAWGARQVGCSTHQMGKRLQKMRARGITTVDLATLKDRTQKYLEARQLRLLESNSAPV